MSHRIEVKLPAAAESAAGEEETEAVSIAVAAARDWLDRGGRLLKTMPDGAAPEVVHARSHAAIAHFEAGRLLLSITKTAAKLRVERPAPDADETPAGVSVRLAGADGKTVAAGIYRGRREAIALEEENGRVTCWPAGLEIQRVPGE